jgi:hypothetical protein
MSAPNARRGSQNAKTLPALACRPRTPSLLSIHGEAKKKYRAARRLLVVAIGDHKTRHAALEIDIEEFAAALASFEPGALHVAELDPLIVVQAVAQRAIGIIEDAIPRALLAVVAIDLRPWHIGIADAGIGDGKDAAVFIAGANFALRQALSAATSLADWRSSSVAYASPAPVPAQSASATAAIDSNPFDPIGSNSPAPCNLRMSAPNARRGSQNAKTSPAWGTTTFVAWPCMAATKWLAS